MNKTTIKRLWISLALLLIGFCSIYALPSSPDIKPSMLASTLPEEFAYYNSLAKKVTGEELKILAKDTEFERRSYYNDDKPSFSAVDASIVFSGKDINNSIHRPERCLVSQGFTIEAERHFKLDVELESGSVSIPFKELVYSILSENGVVHKFIQFYTFVGHDAIVSGHYHRTFVDMKDRMLGGYDQQWAYTTFSSLILSSVDPEQLSGSNFKAHTIDETRENLESFIKDLMPKMLK